MLRRYTELARGTGLRPGGPLKKKSAKKAAADKEQRAAYAAAEDAEQCWCSVCGKAGPVEHSHLYSQHLYEEHKNNPLNWLQSCRKCHDEYEFKRPLFAKKWPQAWAEIIRRMQLIDPKAYDFYAAKTPELYPD
jgi:hypothetical protein